MVTHRLTYLLFVLAGSEFILLLLIRKPPTVISKDPLAYLLAFCGTFAVSLYRPAIIPAVHLAIGDTLVYLGVIFEIIGFLSLNTSVGIVAGNRGIKISGMYRFVRHPIYMSYLILCVGYFLSNATIYNFFIAIMIMVFQILRIQEEERILIADPKYVAYVKVIKWRLIPGIY